MPTATTADALVSALGHPREREILAVREIILGADPRVTEGIERNAPSFRTTEWFATFHLRAKQGVQLILHLGAKARADVGALAVDDPAGLLTWLAKDRAMRSRRSSAPGSPTSDPT